MDASIHHASVGLCGVCNFLFFCENGISMLMLSGVGCWCVFSIFLVTVVHPHFWWSSFGGCWLWGVCSLFKGAWWMPWYAGPMKDV